MDKRLDVINKRLQKFGDMVIKVVSSTEDSIRVLTANNEYEFHFKPDTVEIDRILDDREI